MNYNIKPTILKAVRGGLLAAALLFVATPGAPESLIEKLPAQYRVILVGMALPALRNILKAKVGVVLGGLL